MEQTFVNKDGSATAELGQARGIAMLVPAIHGLSVAEYAPNLVKKTIVGAGHGEGTDSHDAGRAAAEGRSATHDAADALAIAITHALHRQSVVLRGGSGMMAMCQARG